MVALTGIEPAGYRFSSVQLGLSSCVFGLVQFATGAFRAVWMADVLPRCCPGAAPRPGFGFSRFPIPLRAGNPMLADRPGIGIFLARVIQPPPTIGIGVPCSISVQIVQRASRITTRTNRTEKDFGIRPAAFRVGRKTN